LPVSEDLSVDLFRLSSQEEYSLDRAELFRYIRETAVRAREERVAPPRLDVFVSDSAPFFL